MDRFRQLRPIQVEPEPAEPPAAGAGGDAEGDQSPAPAAGLLMGAKVRRRAAVYRDCKGDYIGVPNDPCLTKILSKQGDNKVLFADKVLKFTQSGKMKRRILVITDFALYLVDPDADILKRRIALAAVDKLCISNLSDNFFAIIVPTRGFFECLLRLLNFVLTVAGLAMVGYGIYLLVEWMKISKGGGGGGSPAEVLVLGRPLLGAVALGDSFLDKLPKAWFIYLFIGVGAIVFLVSLFGCIGAGTRNTCCLCFYAFLVLLLILAEAGAAAFIFFDNSWKDVIPKDKTHNFDVLYDFLKGNWEIARWVALGVVVFEAVLFLLALVVRAMNKPAEYDSDDEIIAIGRSPTLRQPLVHGQNAPATGVPVPTLDQRTSRHDAWSQRMREKYGLDTSQFTYNPSDPSRYQQNGAPQAEERGRCTIM